MESDNQTNIINNNFCESVLWDPYLTWYTDNPDFTTCFHQTVLTYTPVIILYLLSPLSILSTKKSRDRNVPWSILNITKTVINLILLILPFIDLGYALDEK